jgi:hypothetical protein
VCEIKKEKEKKTSPCLFNTKVRKPGRGKSKQYKSATLSSSSSSSLSLCYIIKNYHQPNKRRTSAQVFEREREREKDGVFSECFFYMYLSVADDKRNKNGYNLLIHTCIEENKKRTRTRQGAIKKNGIKRKSWQKFKRKREKKSKDA